MIPSWIMGLTVILKNKQNESYLGHVNILSQNYKAAQPGGGSSVQVCEKQSQWLCYHGSYTTQANKASKVGSATVH